MGVSTDAILAYGWDLGAGEDGDHWAYELIEDLMDVPFEGDIDEYVLYKLNYVETNESFEANCRARREILDPLPWEIIHHCSLDDPHYILTLKDACWTAGRGHTVDLKHRIAYLAGSIKEYDTSLYEAAHTLGVEPTEPPGLLLANMWG